MQGLRWDEFTLRPEWNADSAEFAEKNKARKDSGESRPSSVVAGIAGAHGLPRIGREEGGKSALREYGPGFSPKRSTTNDVELMWG
jgi:hypothetical protein